MRRAVNEALDRRALAAVYGERPSDRYVPPGTLTRESPPRYPLTGPDLAEARRLVAGRRGTATLYYCGEASNQRIAEIVRDNLRPIGIRVRINASLGCVGRHDPERDVADIALASPVTLPPDAGSFLEAASGDNGDFGGAETLGRGWWSDPAFTRKLKRADALQGTARDAAFSALQDELLEEDVTLAAFGAFVRPEYISSRVGCRIFQGAYRFLDLGAACVRSN
jgi:ABC-type transport system substrate-binding protein